MNGFEYYTPTKVVFGKDTELKVGELIKKQQSKKVLIHFGGGSAKRSGLLNRIEKSLKNAAIDYVELGGVVPNPRMSKIYEGIDLCKKEKVDFILAVGGGSVIDSAKAIAYGIANDFDVWKIYSGEEVPTKCCPLGTVLTIAAAGSEMSNSSVVTNENGWLKRSHENDISRCKFAILNPELTYSLPPYQTFCGCTDIMMHTMERYFSSADTMDITDDFCAVLLKSVMKNAKILCSNPQDYKARAEVMWAGSLSHNGLMSCGGDGGDWSTHLIEHELGGMFDVAHGAGLAAVWGSWARYVLPERENRFAQFAVNVMGCPNTHDDKKTAILGIEAMEDFFRSINMPTSIHDLGIDLTDTQIDEMAEKCVMVGNGSIGSFKKLYKKDVMQIYKMAK